MQIVFGAGSALPLPFNSSAAIPTAAKASTAALFPTRSASSSPHGTGADPFQLSGPAAINRSHASSLAATAATPVAQPGSTQPVRQSLARFAEGSRSVDFSLELKTQDGDTLRLEFGQEQRFMRGDAETREHSGIPARGSFSEASDARYFKLSVAGDLDAAERAAIESLLTEVHKVTAAFLEGDDAQVLRTLSGFELDGETLSDLSLAVAVQQRATVASSYRVEDGTLAQLRQGGGERLAALESLAAAQKRLITQAQEVFDAPSAVRFVRESFGAFLDGVMSLLTDVLTDAFDVASSADALASQLKPDAQSDQQNPQAELPA